MSSKYIIRTAKEAEAANCGLVKNLHSTQRVVEIEDGFNLYRAIYYVPGRPGLGGNIVFASKSDERAIEVGQSLAKNGLVCEYVNRLILREDGEPSSIIIWGD